ncbi:tetratricopeptide repeat protein [Elusimicrobiota bacterium]
MKISLKRCFLFFLSLFFTFCILNSELFAGKLTENESFKLVCDLYKKSPQDIETVDQALYFLKYFSNSENNLKVSYILANAYGNSQKAIELFKKLAKKKDKEIKVSSFYMLGETYYNMERYNEAVKTLKRFCDKFDEHFLYAEALYVLSQCYMGLNQWEDAIETLDKLVEIAPYYETRDKVIFSFGILDYRVDEYDEALKSFKKLNSEKGLFYQGKCLEHLKKYIPAALTFKKLLDKFSKSQIEEEVRFLVAECFYKGKDYGSAVIEYKKFVEKFKDSPFIPNAYYRIGSCLYREAQTENKHYYKAIEMFELVIDVFRSGEFAPMAYYMLGECFLGEGNTQEALKAYQTILTNYPGADILPQTYYKIGWCYTQLNDYDKAIETYESIVNEFPKYEKVSFSLMFAAENAYRKQDYDAAISYFKKVLDHADKNDKISEIALYAMSKTYFDTEKYNEIISGCHYILNELPKSKSDYRSYTYLLVAEAYYALGFFTEAGKVYDKITEDYQYTKAASLAQEGKSWAYFQVKEYDLAQKEREAYMDDMSVDHSESEKISSQFEMGNIFYNKKQYMEALETFEKFVVDYPDSILVPDAIFSAGRSYYKLQYYTKAIETWEQLVAKYPDHKKAKESIKLVADTYFRAQKYPLAVKTYTTITQLYPEDLVAKQAYLRIAQSYYNSMDDINAIKAFETFIDIYPEDKLSDGAVDGIIMSANRLSETGNKSDVDLLVLQRFVENHSDSNLAPMVQYRLAQRFFEEKEYEVAADEFKRVITDFSTSKHLSDAAFYNAESYYYAKKYKESIDAYEKFVESFPKHESIRIAYLHLANANYYINEFLPAANSYQEATRLSEETDQIYKTAVINTALCFKKAKKWVDAVKVYEGFIKKNPDDESINKTYLDLIEVYEILKKYQEAIYASYDLVDRLPGGDPLMPEVQTKIGEFYVKMGDVDSGIEEYEKLVAIGPRSNAWRLSGLAKLAQEYEKLEEWDNAIAIYTEISNSSSEAKWINAAKGRINAIKQSHVN